MDLGENNLNKHRTKLRQKIARRCHYLRVVFRSILQRCDPWQKSSNFGFRTWGGTCVTPKIFHTSTEREHEILRYGSYSHSVRRGTLERHAARRNLAKKVYVWSIRLKFVLF
jgi:hypothetical protein